MGEMRLKKSLAGCRSSVVVLVGFDHQNGGWRCGGAFGPNDWIKEDRAFYADVSSRPEFSLAGWVEGVPGIETLAMIMERIGA